MKYMLLLTALITQSALGREVVKICYLSSPINGILPRAQDLKLANVGFRLAVNEFNRGAKVINAEFIESEVGRRDFAIPEGVKWANDNDCSVLVGLVSSKDALLAAPFLEKFNILGFSSTATSDELRVCPKITWTLSDASRTDCIVPLTVKCMSANV